MKRIAIGLGVLTVLVLAGPGRAELCEKCKGGTYIMSVGKCVDCGGHTGSGAHKLCKKCSAKLGQCEHCRGALKKVGKPVQIKPVPVKPAPKPAKIDTKKSGKYTSGKWKYQYTIRAVGTRSETRIGSLTYDGNLIAGAKMRDRIKTPWGMMQYYQMYYIRGWMLELTGGTPINPKKGRLLTLPEASATPSPLRPLELDKSHNGKTVSATVGQEIIIRLKSNPTTGYQWVVGKIEGDALGQIGLVKYEQRKHAPGMVGVGGKEAFTFRTTKAGTAKLILEYKGPGKVIARTFTLTVNVKPAPAKHSASYLRPLEVDDSANGKTVSATVGQNIIIRLKGNATTGYSWVAGKIEGDALGQVGKVKYVSDQPPAPAGGRGRGLMMHRVGGGGKYVFTFIAKKAGKAKLLLEYKRGWEKNKPAARTFSLTVNVKADPMAERVKKLKANIDSFTLALRYHGPKDKPLYRSLVLSVPQIDVDPILGFDHVIISRKQAEKVIAHLADEGFLGRVGDNGNVKLSLAGPIYTMEVNCGKMRIYESFGWGLPMLKRLDGLRKVLDGDAAKAMDKLLKRLEGKRKEWKKKTPVKKS